MSAAQKMIPPGGTIGVLGGGPMGRMIALAARTLGYRVRILETTPQNASAGLADVTLASHRLDTRAAAEVARGCDVVTVAFEDIAEDVLEAVSKQAPLRPGLPQLRTAQERQREREWLELAGFNVVPWRTADSRDELVAAMRAVGGQCVIKPRTRQGAAFHPVTFAATDGCAAWVAIRGQPSVVERAVAIDTEISVLVARGINGDVATYPPAVSAREGLQLAWSVLPGDLEPQMLQKAQDLAEFVARKLDVVGLLGVEMFLLTDGTLAINELVPAPHLTYLAADDACCTGQFEQLVRAIAGLPLGSTTLKRPTAALSVPGDHRDGFLRGLGTTLRHADVRVHIYDVAEPTAGRPIAHLSASADTGQDAIRLLLAAQDSVDRARGRRLTRLFRERHKRVLPIRKRTAVG